MSDRAISRHYKLCRDWRDELKCGDIIRTQAGTERIVRRVSLHRDGFLSCVTMVILRCSWTQRAYTVITRADLKTQGYEPTPYRYRGRSAMDRRIACAISYRDGVDGKSLTCCDVCGVR